MREASGMRNFLPCVCVLLLFTSWVARADDALRVGSKRFTESYILAEILAEKAKPHVVTQVRQGLGNTAIVYEALRSGSIDMYAEYTGTIQLEILKNKDPVSLEEMNRQLAPLGLAASFPLGFNNGYALAIRADDADRLGIKTLSDMAAHPELKLGLGNEFMGRADGWKGLAALYKFAQNPVGMDHGLVYEALAAKQIDVTDIYTTDAKINQYKLRILQDDKKYFPRYDAIILHRTDVPTRFPAVWKALQTLSGSISEAEMIAMNARAELASVQFNEIAKDHLAGRTPVTEEKRGFWHKLFGADLARLTWQHLTLVFVSVLIATLIAVPIGVLVFRRARWRAFVLGATGLLQTIPSLALLAVLISVIGVIGTFPALIAVTVYALLPIMRNTVTGLAEVPDGLRSAGTALGLTGRQVMRSVELPLAALTIFAGIRTASTIAVGTATIAAFIGAGGYGERIVTGLALNDRDLLLAGAIPAAALALLSEGFFELIESFLNRRRKKH
jgi:osmoprotectant transport system permease protein